MDIIKCPKCHQDVELDIKNTIDENGEVFMCNHCKFKFRYTLK